MWRLALLLVACGRVDSGALTYRFVDDTREAFDLGGYDIGTVPLKWRDGNVEFVGVGPFSGSDVGIYVSRVFDSSDAEATWQSVRFSSPWPQRPLADNEGNDGDRFEHQLQMNDDILLLHYEGEGATANGDQVPDASGKMHHGSVVHAGDGASYVPGVFGSALNIGRDAWVRLDGSYFDYGTEDFTYATWVKLRDCSQSRSHREVIGGGGGGDSPHMWIGALCPNSCPSGDAIYMNWLDSTRQGGTISACSGVTLDDDEWHLIAGTKSGHTNPPATLAVYVDGKLVATTNYDYAGDFTYDGGEIRIGSFNLSEPKYNAPMVVDETAIWKRALSGDEIAAMLRRGAVRLGLQFRACNDESCDGQPFVGPDGTAATYFSTDGEHDIAALGLTGRYAQYRVRFSTRMPDISPRLSAVTAIGRPKESLPNAE